MEVKISVVKDTVMTEVYKITGYTGKKADDMDKVSSTSDESNILESYFEDAMTAVTDIIARYGYLSTATEITLTLPANYNTNVTSALTNAIKQYVTDYICMQWFNLSKKDELEYYSSLCEGLSLTIRKKIMERTKPTR